MSWYEEKSKRSWLEAQCIKILRNGPIPQHVAVIMDGNRRFADKLGTLRLNGHVQGFEKLAKTLNWFKDLGVKEVTVYAFSIENFKRSSEEVTGLMNLAREKFKKLLEEMHIVQDLGICVRVIGNLSLLPHDLQKLIARIVTITKNNNEAFLNICFAYTSREEMSSAVSEVVAGVKEGLIETGDITEEVLESCLYTSRSPNPDILLRTSGEIRLSDFLLWQSSYSMLAFINVLWPEISIWHLFYVVLLFQLQYKTQQDFKRKCIMERELLPAAEDPSDEDEIRRREKRVRDFLKHVQTKRDEYFEQLCANE